MGYFVSGRAVAAVFAAAVLGGVAPSGAQTVFDFEGGTPLANSIVSGDVSRFAATTEQAHGGTKSLKFADATLEPYENFTYDMPFDFTSGTITVWFYDARGEEAYVPHSQTAAARWAGSVILEDKNNPADFGAVEIAELPYGPKYYASEGAVNRGFAGSDTFDSDSLPLRSVGFHKIEFQVSSTETTIFVDGLMSDEVRGPVATGANLRLRFMADSPSNGGRGGENWVDTPQDFSFGKVADWIYFDDININAELPTVQSHLLDFEISGETADFDMPGQFRGPGTYIPAVDNVLMEGFVDQWSAVTSATVAHHGNAAARFANPPAPWKSVVFDLAGAAPNTTATLWFYDSNGQYGSHDADAAAASVILEEGANPGEFLALEITNLPYPDSQAYNYYLTDGTMASGGYADFYSKAFQAREIGWHKVEIGIYETYTQIAIDGQLGRLTPTSGVVGPVAHGPGLNAAPKLRIMGDSASVGGFSNYVTIDPLDASYLATRTPFAYFDDISIPVTSSAVNDWMTY